MRRLAPALTALLVLMACTADAPEPAPADDPPAPAAAPAPTSGRVTIVSPAEGAEVPAGPLEVTLEVSGVAIVQAGDTTPGTGHHHLYLDEDLAPMDQPVPSIPGRVVHMGDGSATYTFDDVAPGEHRLIAVVADGVHVPLDPPVVDTVTFTVR
jgi:hypothetical protein